LDTQERNFFSEAHEVVSKSLLQENMEKLTMNKSFKKPRQWKAYLTMVKYFFLAQTRNPATFAFGFIFPIVFISILA